MSGRPTGLILGIGAGRLTPVNGCSPLREVLARRGGAARPHPSPRISRSRRARRGETESYGQLAARVDPDLFDPGIEPWRRAREVGAANGRNPVSIIVPCHRVIGADGSLTGYGGGLHRKQALLELEGSGKPDLSWGSRQMSII